MKSFMASPATIERKWYVVDATDMTLGRLASEVAKVLNIKPEEINKALVLGLLSKINELDEEEKRDFTRIGMDILQQWKS